MVSAGLIKVISKNILMQSQADGVPLPDRKKFNLEWRLCRFYPENKLHQNNENSCDVLY